MNFESWAALVFVFLLAVFLLKKRREIDLQGFFPVLYFAMYRTHLGLKAMDRISKSFPRLTSAFGWSGIVVGFVGMGLMVFEIIRSTVQLFTVKEAPGIMPVLPFEAKGVFYVPFFFWVISIFIIAIVHEFAHGVLARRYNIPVKSSGFAFMGVIAPVVPAAFVEPDENNIKKKGFWQQLAVFAAGPMANVATAILVIGLLALWNPLLSSTWINSGVDLVTVTDNGPANIAGLSAGDVLVEVNGDKVLRTEDLSEVLKSVSPGEKASVKTLSGSDFAVSVGSNPQDSSKAWLGVQVRDKVVPNPVVVSKYGFFVPEFVKWVAGLFYWVAMLSLGIGLFNLIPLGPIDGGRMFKLVMERLSPSKGLVVWSAVSIFLAFLVVSNLVIGFLR